MKRIAGLYLVALIVGLTAAGQAALTLVPEPWRAIIAAFLGPFLIIVPVTEVLAGFPTPKPPPAEE